MADFEFVPHTADIAIRARGRTLPELLRNAALGLAAASLGRETLAAYRVAGSEARRLESEGAPDEEGLLVNFLNEVIFQGETHGQVFTDFDFEHVATDTGVRATAYADPALTPLHAVKAATYYDLRIERTADGLQATVVFDV